MIESLLHFLGLCPDSLTHPNIIQFIVLGLFTPIVVTVKKVYYKKTYKSSNSKDNILHQERIDFIVINMYMNIYYSCNIPFSCYYMSYKNSFFYVKLYDKYRDIQNTFMDCNNGDFIYHISKFKINFRYSIT